MFTEKALPKHPSLIRAFMGLPAEIFWQLIADIQTRLSAYEAQRFLRPTRCRAVGGGRAFDQPLVIRVALVLTYLRLPIIPEAVAGLHGATQSDVSRELRRWLSLLVGLLPSPAVWEVVEEAVLPAATAVYLTASVSESACLSARGWPSRVEAQSARRWAMAAVCSLGAASRLVGAFWSDIALPPSPMRPGGPNCTVRLNASS